MSSRPERSRASRVRARPDRRSRPRGEELDEVIWMREEPGSRRAGLSREEIGATALKIADTDGFDELSMRRIARELGAGTMSLYHYVRSKDELLAVMWDAVGAELIVPDDELSGDWRAALTKIARATRRAFKKHPWIFEAMGEPAQSGPNSLKHFEQSLAAVSDLKIPPRKRLELVALVDDYVFGFALREVLQQMYDAEGDPNMAESGMAFFESQLATGDYPNVSKLFRGDLREAMERVMETFTGDRANDRRFEHGLKILFDGFEKKLG